MYVTIWLLSESTFIRNICIKYIYITINYQTIGLNDLIWFVYQTIWNKPAIAGIDSTCMLYEEQWNTGCTWHLLSVDKQEIAEIKETKRETGNQGFYINSQACLSADLFIIVQFCLF